MNHHRYIPAEEIPVQYGGFMRENDFDFYGDDYAVSELFVKAGTTQTIEIPAPKVFKEWNYVRYYHCFSIFL